MSWASSCPGTGKASSSRGSSSVAKAAPRSPSCDSVCNATTRVLKSIYLRTATRKSTRKHGTPVRQFNPRCPIIPLRCEATHVSSVKLPLFSTANQCTQSCNLQGLAQIWTIRRNSKATQSMENRWKRQSLHRRCLVIQQSCNRLHKSLFCWKGSKKRESLLRDFPCIYYCNIYICIYIYVCVYILQYIILGLLANPFGYKYYVCAYISI